MLDQQTAASEASKTGVKNNFKCMHQYNYKYVKNVFLGWGGGSEEKTGMEEVNEKVNYRDALYLNNHHIIL